MFVIPRTSLYRGLLNQGSSFPRTLRKRSSKNDLQLILLGPNFVRGRGGGGSIDFGDFISGIPLH